MSVLEQIKGRLIVSCQALPDEPLHSSYIMSRMAVAAMEGGAAGIRAQSVEDINAIANVCPLPIIGIIKRSYKDSEIYITPTLREVEELLTTRAEIIALDATGRRRPSGPECVNPSTYIPNVGRTSEAPAAPKYEESTCRRPEKVGSDRPEESTGHRPEKTAGQQCAELVRRIHEGGRLAMADCSTFEECLAAQDMGFDIVSTTLSGYTKYSPDLEGPDFELIRKCAEQLRVPIIAEGRIHTPEDLKKAFECGAFSAVVGGAITRPQQITARFIKVLGEPS